MHAQCHNTGSPRRASPQSPEHGRPSKNNGPPSNKPETVYLANPAFARVTTASVRRHPRCGQKHLWHECGQSSTFTTSKTRCTSGRQRRTKIPARNKQAHSKPRQPGRTRFGSVSTPRRIHDTLAKLRSPWKSKGEPKRSTRSE